MIAPSSTSSSERLAPSSWLSPAPWGLLGAIGLLLALELGLRILDPRGVVPYAGGDREYTSLDSYLTTQGAREIAILGNSRPKIAMANPLLTDVLPRKAAGAPYTVGNYAISGAHAEETRTVVSLLLAASTRPRLLVYGVTPRDLAVHEEGQPFARYLWHLQSFLFDRKLRGSYLDAFLPQVLRNEASRFSFLFRLRYETYDAFLAANDRDVIAHLKAIVKNHAEPPPLPFDGAPDPQLMTRDADSSRRISRAAARRYLGERYRDPDWPHTVQEKFLEALARKAKNAQVPLVFVEIPLNPALQAELPPNTLPGFYEVMARVSAQYGAPFIRVSDLGTKFVASDFREVSHLNRIGAKKFCRALAPKLTPYLPKE